ncbi:hypothetical protein HYN48_01635 [Flavobacterium magnum]|uniref:Uncharacterized protein n=1 Tax=Flavobacterium magnum TaxID=2162713 RepID=A0A2S0RCA4_9FLAO|nr:hypothetical protein [Flavobacterium magnum]AWA28890.1 hypothetical protein HYN48_01635 [Flavobacterium magnum]
METGKKNHKRLLFSVITFVIAFGLAFFVTTKLMSGNSVMAQAKAEIESVNKKCPMKIDEMTRLDSVTLSEKTVNYHYVILKLKDSLPQDMSPAMTEIKAKAQDNLDQNPKMGVIRNNQFSLKYIYKDKVGEPLFDFTLQPKK